jgi:hypothetical protein
MSRVFSIPFNDVQLRGDILGKEVRPSAIFLHGAGKSERGRLKELREFLVCHNISSASFDFKGHGETGGKLECSSLRERTEQAQTIIDKTRLKDPLIIAGFSMSGYTAIKLTSILKVKTLILFVPAVYGANAYEVTFGPAFSKIIRATDNWYTSDAFEIMKNFDGNLLIIKADNDEIIPIEVPRKIYDSALRARSRKMISINRCPHAILAHLKENKKDFNLVTKSILAMTKSDVVIEATF